MQYYKILDSKMKINEKCILSVQFLVLYKN